MEAGLLEVMRLRKLRIATWPTCHMSLLFLSIIACKPLRAHKFFGLADLRIGRQSTSSRTLLMTVSTFSNGANPTLKSLESTRRRLSLEEEVQVGTL